MKQHTIPKDLEMLTEKGKERLEKWIGEIGVAFIYKNIFYTDKGFWDAETMLPLLSIGQMIEFLDEQAEINEIYYARTTPYWRIEITKRSLNRGHVGHIDIPPNSNFCDALWNACLEVFNNDALWSK